MSKIKIVISMFVLCCFISSCKEDTTIVSTDEKEIKFNLPENFVLEDLYQPSNNEQGSWVALAQGANNTMYACDQYGKIYHFNIPKEGDVLNSNDISPLDLDIGEAHGLLWAFNSLYVAVNKKWDEEVPDEQENGSGVYRITDTNNDGELDHIEMLLKLNGAGEHGPHSLVLSPEGAQIYFIAGNHTLIPDLLLEKSRLPTNWDEDNLFTPYLDARGHASEIKAPGGWIAKFNPDGTDWEIMATGFRNPFDMAFNQDGELFAYDADMEWDIGMPWYRPTRICHVTSGSEFGWRTGSGKWPEYYPDALPAIHNLEQGSPTGVLSGAKLNFPANYKNGLFVMDWSFGTIYFIDLKPKESSYLAEREEFLSGSPLPLTDMIAGVDGNLYFATGGRRIDSHLYRLRYIGTDRVSAENTSSPVSENLRELRHNIEKYHTQISPNSIPLAWKNLNHSDRFIRYASRIALEHQPVKQWQNRFFSETDPERIIEASISLARQGDKSLQSQIVNKLNRLPFETLSTRQQINILRSYQLLFIRMGTPNVTDGLTTAKRLKAYFPHTNNAMNRELGSLLLYLKADGITEGLVSLLDKHTKEKTRGSSKFLSEETTLRSEEYGSIIRDIISKMPPSEAIYYGVLLSHAESGWTKTTRKKYFQWFYDVLSAKGGLSFKPGMENIRLAAMKHVPEKEKGYFQEFSGVYSPSTAIADLPQPIGPGSQYNSNDFSDIIWGENPLGYKNDFARGNLAYKAGMCVLCHRMRGEGGAVGTDLTQVADKFSKNDLLFAIYSPNDEISDQYANTLFHMNNGTKLAGRIKNETEDTVTLMPNPFNETFTVELAKLDIEKRELSPLSPMPSGLLNRLNINEIKDLFTYLLAGGDSNHPLYTETEGK